MLIDYRFIIIARMFEDDVKDSIRKNIIDRITDLDLWDYFSVTQEKIVCHITGAYINTFGIANNPGKIKSVEACDLILIEEGEEVEDYAWKKIIPTLRDAKGEKVTIATIYNPEWEDSDTHQRLIVNQEKLVGGRFIRHINYLDNCFLNPKGTEVKEAEQCKIDDIDDYNNRFLGIAMKTSKLQVFNGCFEIIDFEKDAESRFPTHPNALGYLGEIEYLFGVAIGYSQKPSFVIRCFFFDGVLYVDKEFSDVDVRIPDLAKTTFNMPSNDDGVTYCDPRTPTASDQFSDELSNFGGSAIVADKWQNDVIDSIIYMRNHVKKIVIHPRCVATAESFKRYRWEYDKKKEEILSNPIERDDQGFHAVRFAINDYIQGHKFL